MYIDIILLCILPYVLAGLTGAIVAFFELSSRFSDDFKRVFSSYSSWIYLLVNAFSAVFIFILASTFDIKISNMGVTEHPIIGAVVIGLVSMGLLRSSLINFDITGVQDKQSVGTVIQRMLKWVEVLYDREKSRSLIKEIDPIIRDVSFEILYKEIVPICIAAFSNPNHVDNDEINKQIGQLRDKDILITEDAKIRSLALTVAKKVGIEILAQCTKNYKSRKEGYTQKVEMYPNDRITKLQERLEKLKVSISSPEE